MPPARWEFAREALEDATGITDIYFSDVVPRHGVVRKLFQNVSRWKGKLEFEARHIRREERLVQLELETGEVLRLRFPDNSS